MPIPLVVECLEVLLLVVRRMINLSLQTGSFSGAWKHSHAWPRLKKPNYEATLTDLRHISNLSFPSKLCERAVFLQTHDHHCVKWGVSWCWNHTIRTRIPREYGHPGRIVFPDTRRVHRVSGTVFVPIGFNPCHGKSNVRIRHWHGACGDLEISDLPQIITYRRTVYERAVSQFASFLFVSF